MIATLSPLSGPTPAIAGDPAAARFGIQSGLAQDYVQLRPALQSALCAPRSSITKIALAVTAERQHGAAGGDLRDCLLRCRLIMMTTVRALLGDMLVSQVLTLFTAPVVYLYLDRAHYWYMQRKQSCAPGRRSVRLAARENTVQ
jgi:hypothetical protein